MSQSKQGNNKSRKRRNRKRRNKKSGNTKNASNKPNRALCRYFNSPRGCRHGEKCKFVHEERKKDQMSKTWWRKGPEPQRKEFFYEPDAQYVTELEDILNSPQIDSSFVNQLVLCLTAPRRVTQKINNESALIASIVREYVPKIEIKRHVQLFPLLGKIYEFSLNCISICPRTSRLYVGGNNTPVFYIEMVEPEPKLAWLCGPSWEENGVSNSLDVSDIVVSGSGCVFYCLTYRNMNIDDEPGPYACLPGGQPQKLKFAMPNGKPLSMPHKIQMWMPLSISTSDVGDELLILCSNFLFRFEFRDAGPDETLILKEAIELDRERSRSHWANVFPICGTKIIAAAFYDVVYLCGHGKVQACWLNLQIRGFCSMPRNNGAVLMHSPQHLRIVEKNAFIESLSDGNLKQRIEERSHILHSKGIFMDRPLLTYDNRNHQVVTDVDSRVFAWLDIY